MLSSHIICNCHKKLDIPDDDFLKLLTIILGDMNHYDDRHSSVLSLSFKGMHIFLSSAVGWRNLVYSNRLQSMNEEIYYRLDLRVTRELFQKVANNVIR